MKKYIKLIFIIIVLSNAFASADEKEILITSSKLIKNQLLGGTTHIITKEDIMNYPGESLVKIISKLPGIEFKSLYGNGFGSYESIDLRGFADTAKSNTVILLNGHKLSNIDSGFVDFTTIPINSVQRIEVIKGNSASVLYGGGATGGAINIITDQIPDSESKYFASTTTGSYGQFEAYVSGTKSFNDLYSITGNSSYAISDGYRRNNALRQKNGNVELNGTISNKTSFHINISAFDNYVELPGDVPVYAYSAEGLSMKNGFEIDPRSTDTPRDFATKHGHKVFLNSSFFPKNNVEIINDINYRFNKSQGFFFGSATKHIDSEMDVISYNPKTKFNFNYFGFDVETISGIDSAYTYYRSDRMATDGFATKQVYKFSDTNLAIYLNSEINLKKIGDIGFGARIQGNWFKASDFVGPVSGASRDNADSLTYDPQYSLHLGYEKKIKAYGTFFGRIARSFRYPNVDERIGQTVYGSDNATGYADHDFKLRTQISNDFELGHKYRNKKFNFSNSFYYMNLRAELYYDSVDFINKNLDATKRYGFESFAGFQVFPKVYLTNAFTTSKAKMRAGKYKGNEIPGNPSITNTFEINFEIIPGTNLYSNLYYKGSTRMINDTKNFQTKIAEYYLLNMGLKGEILGFNYSFAANNVLNKSYYNYAVGSASTYNAYNVYPLSEFNMLFKISKQF